MISQTTEYALRAATALAEHGTTPRTGRALAAATHIPGGYLTKVLAPLVRARLVRASRGAKGGYRLDRDPASVALLDVIHAVESPPTTGPAPQPPPPRCALHRRIDQATASFEEAFRDVTLADLLAEAARAGATHPPGPCVRCRRDASAAPDHAAGTRARATLNTD